MVNNIYKVVIRKILVDRAENALALQCGNENGDPIIAVFTCTCDMTRFESHINKRSAEIKRILLKFSKGYFDNAVLTAVFVTYLIAYLVNCHLNKVLYAFGFRACDGMTSQNVSCHKNLLDVIGY